MTVEELLRANKITGLKSTARGRYYTACPQCSHTRTKAHQRTKVLGVTITADGVNWGCNHCNWTGPEKGINGTNGHARGNENVVTYDYVDENGELLFQKVRGANKKFWQRKPDGAGGWVNKLGDTRKVIYRLPEVIEAIAADHAVCVVEGEKDADNLWRIGVPATCNPDGAAEPGKKPKWRPEYSELLRGADIVVMGDNDPAGRAHVEATASMSVGIASRIRVLDLAQHWPGIPKGGDVSDWIHAGHTREELDALIAQAPDLGKVQAPPKLIVTMAEFLAGFVPPDYLICGIMQRHFFYALTGMTSAGKTAIALLIAVLVSMRTTGLKLGSYEVEHGRVIYIAKENPTDVRMRVIGMAVRMGFDPTALDIGVIEQLGNLEKDIPRIKKEIEDGGGEVALVIIDTTAATFPGDDENSNTQLGAHARVQRTLCDLPGHPTVLALCHPPKNPTSPDQLLPRGGGSYIAETDGNFTLWAHGDKLSDLHWTGKLRGPDFEKITFRLSTVTTSELVDSKGRLIPTVMAEVVSDEQAAENEAKALFQENRLLTAMLTAPHGSLSDWAQHCGWMMHAQPGDQPKPYKSLAQRVMKRLIASKFVTKNARGYTLTKSGIETAQNHPKDVS